MFRCAKIFINAIEWVYCCSCDDRRRALVSSLNPTLDISSERFHRLHSKCVHGKVMKSLIATDSVNNILSEYDFAGKNCVLII